jgi:hypothetical protein
VNEQANETKQATLRATVLQRGCQVLRGVAEGNAFPSAYFWATLWALEALRDGDALEAELWNNRADEEQPKT